MRRPPRTWPRRDVVVALDDASKSAKAAASASTRITSSCTSTISTRRCCTSACPAFPRARKIFAGVDVTQRADPGPADRALQHGRHPTNYHGEVLTTTRTAIRTTVVPGPDGGGRSGLRLGAWREPSGLELADRPCRVRPRGGACGCKEMHEAGRAAARTLPKDSANLSLARSITFRHANGGSPTAKLRDRACSA